jgi:hypothetical protein
LGIGEATAKLLSGKSSRLLGAALRVQFDRLDETAISEFTLGPANQPW